MKQSVKRYVWIKYYLRMLIFSRKKVREPQLGIKFIAYISGVYKRSGYFAFYNCTSSLFFALSYVSFRLRFHLYFTSLPLRLVKLL